jgi:hypothetical protein
MDGYARVGVVKYLFACGVGGRTVPRRAPAVIAVTEYLPGEDGRFAAVQLPDM